MGYIDVAIPLIAGLLVITIPDKLIQTRDATYEKKKSLITKSGYVLIAVSLLYFVVKIFGQ